jgi:hypothetical protein
MSIRLSCKWLVVAGAAVSILAVSYRIYSDPLRKRTYKMTATPQKIDALFRETKPVCFGRYLIDVPKSADVVWGPSEISAEIDSYPDQGHKIAGEIQDKIKEIQSEKHRTEPSMLIGVFDGPNVDSKIIVGYQSSDDAGFAKLFSYIKLGRNAYVQTIPQSLLAVSDSTAYMGLRDDKTLYKKDVVILQDIAGRLRVRTDEEVPTERGICIEAGFVSGDTPKYQERISIGFRFPEYPDVTFSLSSFKTDRFSKDNTLDWSLKRTQEAYAEQGDGHFWNSIDMLRKGAREISGWSGDEALARMPAKGDYPSVHEFAFKYAGKPTYDPFHPVVDIKLNTGVSGNTAGVAHPSLTDDEAVALWDKLTSTIRVRPVAGTQ